MMAVLGASLALAQTTVPATKKPKTSATKATTSTKKTTAKKKSAKSAKKSPSVARQAAPTPDRYKEIQQALVDKGYLKTEPTGVWDNDSVAAMTQFQNDKKLPATGKISAASLIGLGLGPSTAGGVPPGGGGPINPSRVSSPSSASSPSSTPSTSSADTPHSQAN